MFGYRKRRLVAAAVILFALPIIGFFLLNWLFPLRFSPVYSTIVYDRNGAVVHTFLSPDEKWRFKMEQSEISDNLKKVFLNKEDKWFYYHWGVNPFSLVRAAWNNLLHAKRTSGASTISMQVARLLEPKERTYWNKIVEIFRAFQLEYKFTKDELFEMYINRVPYGGNVEGVKAASLIFFNKFPQHLSIAELTVLSIIPNRPSSWRIDKNRSEVLRVRNKWLRRWAAKKIFSSTAIKDALRENLTASRQPLPRNAPHFCIRAKQSKEFNIHTTIDLELQRKCENIVKTYVGSLEAKDIHNAAVLVVENASGKVLAYVGSADFNNRSDGGQVDGIRAVRQPGSTLKPLLYGLCFDAGIFTPKMTIADVPSNFEGYVPENYDSRFRGNVSVEYALENSLNVPAVKALEMLGKEKMIDALKRCGFASILQNEHKLGLSLVLGGCGVTLEEMTNLYRAIANKGCWSPLQWSSAMQPLERRDTILSPSSAFMLSEILSKTARPDLPINWEGSQTLPRVAWKTGTSYGRKDAWSIGFNNKYTVGVWVGNFNGKGAADLNGASIATPLLFQLFNVVDYRSPNNWYDMPKECGIRTVCSRTGKLPEEFCADRIDDYFIPMVSPYQKCSHMVEVNTDPHEQISYCTECLPVTGYKKKLYENHTPEIIRWMEENRIPYQPIPPHYSACTKLFLGNGPKIISPVHGNEYLLDKNDPQPIQLICETSSDVKWVYWWINNQMVAKTTAQAKTFHPFPEGTIKISCSDDKGRNTDVWIKVKMVDL